MPSQPEAEFGITEARRILGEVFAPWVQDLNLSVERIEHLPPPDVPDWQPAALLRMPFSERLCRNGGVVCGQALMALADTAMVIANLAANRGYRPMTTVDQTTHFMRAVSSSDVLADARVVRLGRSMSFGRVTLLSATDNKPVGDGVERVRDAAGVSISRKEESRVSAKRTAALDGVMSRQEARSRFAPSRGRRYLPSTSSAAVTMLTFGFFPQ
ncbi:uncharacterized protein (TIGR00369 family) [Bradyrhizobium sp. F1.13.1]